MKRTIFFFAFSSIGYSFFSQNDLDAIRYSQKGIGGSARFTGMGGAFGAVGADLSCAAYNPAGLAVLRRSDFNISAGIKFTNNSAKLYNRTASMADANTVFNNFGIAGVWRSESTPDNRHVLAFSNTQVQNFKNVTSMTAYTNSTSIAADMLTLANEQKKVDDLNSSYEKLGYNTYVLDYDSASGKFFSFVDLHRTVKQTRDISTSGRLNDLNISYAYSLQDKFYFGVSLGLPQLNYVSNTTHTEFDEKDSMRVTLTSPGTYTSTYSDPLPAVYSDKLGFNNLTYEEYFKTSGSGIDLKIGGIVRLNDILRVGVYYHSPTIYNLTDVYYNKMTTAFDKNPKDPETWTYPENGGTFDYKIITPSRVGINSAFVFGTKAVFGLDYEAVNYGMARITSTNVSDFAGVNAVIEDKYTVAHNLRAGWELNLKPVMLRIGYAMQGSPFGKVFSGDLVRNTFSAGVGLRTTNNFYFDCSLSKSYSGENYYLFTTMNTRARLNYSNTVLSVTAGLKF